MAGTDERPAAARLLCECAPRRNERGCAGSMRNLFRHDRWAGVCVRRRGGLVECDRARFTCGAVGGSANLKVDKIPISKSEVRNKFKRSRDQKMAEIHLLDILAILF